MSLAKGKQHISALIATIALLISLLLGLAWFNGTQHAHSTVPPASHNSHQVQPDGISYFW